MNSARNNLYKQWAHFALIILSIQLIQVARSNASSDLYPGKKLEPSLAASCASGTIVAVSYPMKDQSEKEALVLLMGTSSSVTRNPDFPYANRANGLDEIFSSDVVAVESSWLKLEGIHVFRHFSDVISTSASSQWTILGSSAVSCMTGLASDVDYLSRILQKQVDGNRIVYETHQSATNQASHHSLAVKLVQKLSNILQEATQYQDSRPYGIQALVVGVAPLVTTNHPFDSNNQRAQRRQRLNLWTLDPTGGFRHWGAATAIGRKAVPVRQQLHRLLSEGGAPENASKALHVCLQACLEATQEPIRYEALLVWVTSSGDIAIGTIDPKLVKDCQDAVLKEMADSNSHGKTI